ncbi:hypothetical protein [Mycobacteroides abscessus]|uniref:hypothetical protein n=1 Tax=Mycobacteroides abscessus TaxID=36809 RepID=UPI0006ACC6F2|nr:hypothetical protein [Mycobacteroides abscessus]
MTRPKRGSSEHVSSLGTSVPPEVTLPRYEPAPQPPDEWTGEASNRARDLDEKLAQRRQSLRSAHSSVADTVRQANLLTQKAQGELAAVEQAWQRDKAAFAHISGTAEGRAALLRAAQLRINEASQVVRDAAAQFQLVAAQVHTAASSVTALDTYASNRYLAHSERECGSAWRAVNSAENRRRLGSHRGDPGALEPDE